MKFRVLLRKDGGWSDYEILITAANWEKAQKKALLMWRSHPEKFTAVMHMFVYDEDDND